MLSRYASIDDNGKYNPPKNNSKAMYSTMIYVRTMLIDWSEEHFLKQLLLLPDMLLLEDKLH